MYFLFGCVWLVGKQRRESLRSFESGGFWCFGLSEMERFYPRLSEMVMLGTYMLVFIFILFIILDKSIFLL